MTEGLISVIVPVYEVEAYLENCIRSILNQTYENLQIILVDDGSPDTCGEICDGYAKKDSRITVIHKENGGVSDARNAGLDVAEGDYIAFVDADDYIHPQMFQVLLDNLQKYGADISGCLFRSVYDLNTGYGNAGNHISIYTNTEALDNLYGSLYIPTVVMWNKLYKRTLFREIRFPCGKIHEDEFTMYRLLYQCEIIVFTDALLYCYLRRKSGITGRSFNIHKTAVIQAHEECFKFLYGHNEMPLFGKAFNRYLNTLISNYYKIKRSKAADKFFLKQLKRKYILNYKQYSPIAGLSPCRRFRFRSFIISESFCKLLCTAVNYLKGVG